MSLRVCTPASLRWTAAALALLAGWLALPDGARAGCGEHVSVRPRDEALVSGSHASTHPAGKRALTPSAPAPCTRPNCSRAPRPLPSAPAPVAPSSANARWALIDTSLELSAPRPSGARVDVLLVHAILRPLRIERPPRLYFFSL